MFDTSKYLFHKFLARQLHEYKVYVLVLVSKA